MIAPNCDRIECEERNNLKKANPVNFIVNFHSLCDISRDCSHHFVIERDFAWVLCPKILPSRTVSDESLGRDEMSCVRLATNNISLQIIVSFIFKCYIIIQSSSLPAFGLVKQPQGTCPAACSGILSKTNNLKVISKKSFEIIVYINY